MTQKNRTLVVKDYSKLEQYGFKKQGSAYYFYTGNKGKWGSETYTIYANEKSHNIRISSHANITLELICKMFVDGVIEFEDNNSLEMRLAKKEKKIKELEAQIAKLKGEINEIH